VFEGTERGPTLGGEPQRRVLVIEDEDRIQEMLTWILLTNGYAVTATDSALGVPKLLRQVQPHVVLLDLGLPYESGASLLRSLKADPETVAIPIVIVSALPEVLTVERRAMAVEVIKKPFTAGQVLDAVRRAARLGT
jgi:DNA-binding response OmpR family regulator